MDYTYFFNYKLDNLINKNDAKNKYIHYLTSF